MAEIKLHHFFGGLHPDENKHQSTTEAIQTLPLSKQLILPIKQHIGASNEIQVSIGDHVLKNQELAHSQSAISAPIHAPTSGTIIAIEHLDVPHPSGMSAMCIVLEPDGKDSAISQEKRVSSDSQKLVELIKQAGIVGLGGAAFPTAAKISATHFDHIETLIINGAECEPFITCDDMLMQEQPDKIIAGIEWLQKIVNPQNTLIGIENNKSRAINAMQEALAKKPLSNTSIQAIPTLYPSGGEKQLITILTGEEVPHKKLAFDVGMLCQNVGTCAAIADALNEQQAMTSRIVTVSGDGVNKPGNFEVKLGTPVSDLIKAAGGYTEQASLVVMGGPMMGFTLPHDQLPIIKSSNAILVLSDKFNPNQPTQACIRCAKCAEVCPSQLLPQQLYWYSRAQQFDRLNDYHLFDCIECGCCSAVCPSHIPLVQYYRFAKGQMRIKEQAQKSSDHARHRFEFREHRLAENKRKLDEARRKKREALAAKKQQQDDKTKIEKTEDPIQAALERVKAKQAEKNNEKKNTTNLTPDQQRQIDEADKRRKDLKQ